jgi:hypothetical protein
MNIVRVNIEFFNGYKKIKKRRISFVLGYLRMKLLAEGKAQFSIFLRPNRILTVELHRRFLYYSFFFQEKTLGDISFKLGKCFTE